MENSNRYIKMEDHRKDDSSSEEANGEISFIYKNKEPIYETPASLPTTPAPAPPVVRPTMNSDVMEKLARNLEMNTRYLRSLAHCDDYIDEEARNRRNALTPVEVRVTFIRVIDVDTSKQTFSAEVFIQAKWQEPGLTGKSQQDLDRMDLRRFWDPLISVGNTLAVDEDRKWRRAISEEPGYRYPVMYSRRRMRGTFSEPLELKNFPIDVQALNLRVESERESTEIEIFEDGKEISSVLTDNFADEQEWLIYEHVETSSKQRTAEEEYKLEMTGGDGASISNFNNPSANFLCHVARRPGYFLWNIILFMFVLTALSFSAWSIEPESPHFRLPVILLLMLTCVTFRLSLSRFLPATSYVSFLDIYGIAAFIFLALKVIAVCVISVYAKDRHKHYEEIDAYVAMAFAILLAIFNVIYLAFLFVKGFMLRQDLLDKDQAYFNKRKRMRERRYKKLTAKPQPKPQADQPKIVYINADTNATVVKPKKKSKKIKQNSVPVAPEEKVYTVDRKEELERKRHRMAKRDKERIHRENAGVTSKSRHPHTNPRVAPQHRPPTPEYEMTYDPQPTSEKSRDHHVTQSQKTRGHHVTHSGESRNRKVTRDSETQAAHEQEPKRKHVTIQNEAQEEKGSREGHVEPRLKTPSTDRQTTYKPGRKWHSKAEMEAKRKEEESTRPATAPARRPTDPHPVQRGPPPPREAYESESEYDDDDVESDTSKS